MRKVKLLWIFLTVIPIILLILGYVFPNSFFASQEMVRSFLVSYGSYAPLVFILLQVAQVVITPLNHYVVGLAGGFIFGPWYGSLFNWIGRVLGALIAFFLGRKFGRRLLYRFANKEDIAKYDGLFEKGSFVLFLMYFLPLFPDDELSYLAGFSAMKKKVFIVSMSLGHIGGAASLAFLGSGLSYTNPWFIVIAVATLISGVIALFILRNVKKAVKSTDPRARN